MKKHLWVLVAGALMVGSVHAASMLGWNEGWNNMATIGGVATEDGGGSISIQPGSYATFNRVKVAFETYDMFDGNGVYNGNPIAYSWANAFGIGAHFFDGSIRDASYNGTVLDLTAVEWNGSTGVEDTSSGPYEWLLNNYGIDTNKEKPWNSIIRGTNSSATLDGTNFVANMTSTGKWYWYNPLFPDSQMSGWIQGFAPGLDTLNQFSDYHNRYMTGNFRLIANITNFENPELNTFTLQYEVALAPAVVPVPAAAPLGLLGMGLVAFVRRRRKNLAA